MAKFDPVTPEDFWSTVNVLGINFEVSWGGASADQSNPAYKSGYDTALKNQILLHRSLDEISADQTYAAGLKRQANADLTKYTRYLNNLYEEYPDLDTGSGPVYDEKRALRDTYKTNIANLKNQIQKQYTPWITFLQSEYDAEVAREKKNGTYKAPKTLKAGGKVARKDVKVNVGAVKEAYFSSQASFTELANLSGTNTPPAVKQADELWLKSSGHKGMIQTYGEIASQQTFTDTENKSANITIENYGFQFLYNPASINMGYSGIPDVDITMYTSGKAMTNLWAPNSFQSNITFDLVLNRMFDLKYYDKTTQKISSKYKPENLYVGRIPSKEDQALISEKGTMYDLEYLLSTTIGFKQETRWRGNTADLGWVSAMPVELHLGKNLRYLVVVSGINVNHVIFDERMVPIFTTVRINCQRIPDYPTTVQQSVYDGTNDWYKNGTGAKESGTVKITYDVKTNKPVVEEWTYDVGTGGGSWKTRG